MRKSKIKVSKRRRNRAKKENELVGQQPET